MPVLSTCGGPHPTRNSSVTPSPLRVQSPSSEPALPVAEYAEPDLVQVSPGSQPGPSTFKPLPDEGYTLPLVVSHYDVPGKRHEYAEPLPPEPEYATPFSEPEPAGTHPSCPPVRYDAPTPRPGEVLGGATTTPSGERTASPAGDTPSAEGPRFPRGDCPLSHVYHEAL